MLSGPQPLEDWTERLVVTVPEAAAILGIGRNAAYNAVAERQIPFIRIGNSIRIPVSGLKELLGLVASGKSGLISAAMVPALPPPRPLPKIQFMLRITAEDKRELQKFAAEDGVSMSKIASQMLETAIRERKEKCGTSY